MSSKENQIRTLDEIESRTHPLSSSIFKIYLKNLHKMCWLVQMRLTWFYKEKKFNDKKFIKNFKKYYLKLFRMEKEKFFIPKFTEWFSEFAEYIGKTIIKSDHKTIQETNSSSEDSVSFKNTSVSPAVINSKNDEEKFEEKLKKPKEHIAAQSPHDLESVDQSVRVLSQEVEPSIILTKILKLIKDLKRDMIVLKLLIRNKIGVKSKTMKWNNIMKINKERTPFKNKDHSVEMIKNSFK